MKETQLAINNLALEVNLGWPDAERKKQQTILLDLTIEFNEPPIACSSDELKDTVCYSELILQIKREIDAKPFHLIEHLGAEVYKIAKAYIPFDCKIAVRISKFPEIPGLAGGVYFNFKDIP